jgi:hypothetical protein
VPLAQGTQIAESCGNGVDCRPPVGAKLPFNLLARLTPAKVTIVAVGQWSRQRPLWPTTCRPICRASGGSSLQPAIALPLGRKAVVGRECALTTGCFQAAEEQWLLSGDDFGEQSAASRPSRDL